MRLPDFELGIVLCVCVHRGNELDTVGVSEARQHAKTRDDAFCSGNRQSASREQEVQLRIDVEENGFHKAIMSANTGARRLIYWRTAWCCVRKLSARSINRGLISTGYGTDSSSERSCFGKESMALCA